MKFHPGSSERDGYFDYAELLFKYICHVGHMEGVNFLTDGHFSSAEFSRKEWGELQRIEDLPIPRDAKARGEEA